MSTLLFLSGSLRRASVNTAAIRAARAVARTDPRVQRTALLPLAVPFYDGDTELAGAPRTVRAVRDAVQTADALVISTPAYNGAPPGVLKNLLDWLSRPAGASALDGRLVATMSASPGRLGGLDAQHQLRAVLTRIGARLVDVEPLVAISGAVDKCTAAGELVDPLALVEIERLVAATVTALYPAPHPAPHLTLNPTSHPALHPAPHPAPHPALNPTPPASQHPAPHPTRHPALDPTPPASQHPTPHPALNPTPTPRAHPTPTPHPTPRPTPHPTLVPTGATP